MTTGWSFTQVRKGMQVKTADGVKLGKIKEIWYGTDPTEQEPRCDEAVCSRLEVVHGLVRREVFYIPYNALADVAGRSVILNVDAAALDEKGWTFKPQWIPRGKQYNDGVPLSPGGTDGIGG